MVRSSKLVTCVSTHSQSCPTLCDSMDYSSPGSSIHGIFQAKILEWVDISFSNGSSRPRGQTHATWEAPLSYLHYNNYLTTPMMKMACSFMRWQEQVSKQKQELKKKKCRYIWFTTKTDMRSQWDRIRVQIKISFLKRWKIKAHFNLWTVLGIS